MYASDSTSSRLSLCNTNNFNSLSNLNSNPNNYGIKSSFTDRILTHKRDYEDTTLEAEKRATLLRIQKRKKRLETITKLDQEFDNEYHVAIKIQNELIQQQHRMSLLILKNFSIIIIQSLYRCYIAKKELSTLKKKRLLIDYIYFKLYFYKRKYHVKIIQHYYRSREIRLLYLDHKKKSLARKIIARSMKSYATRKTIYRLLKILCVAKVNLKHIMLFGIRRATKKIVRAIESQQFFRMDARKMLKYYYRRKRKQT